MGKVDERSGAFNHTWPGACRSTVSIGIILLVLMAGSTALAGPTNGLVASYSFSGNANDSSGNGHHGTAYGATLTTDRFGNANGAYRFDGVDDHVAVPYAPAFQLPVFTMSAWVKPDIDYVTASGPGLIVGRGEDFATDDASSMLLVAHGSSPYGSGGFLMYETGSGSERYYSSGVFPSEGLWTHMAVTRAADGTITMYANGGEIGNWTGTTAPTGDCYQDLTIGARWYGSGSRYTLENFFTGSIDDVMIYDRALSADEVGDLAAIPSPAALLLGSLGTGLVSWMKRRKAL